MNYKSRFSGSVLAAFVAVVMLAVPVAGNAQDTTGSIRGKVLDPSGSPVGGATIVVEDMRSGVTRTLTTSNGGIFLASRLLPGGPYKVTVNGTKTVDIASVSLAETHALTINMTTEVAIEEIVTIGQAASLVQVASGPSATFSIDDLESSVAFSRDIADVYSIDPRLMIDNDEDGFGLNCAGKHPKFNNITLDGVSQADRFGLNDSGYSTIGGMPFPFDAIEQVAVELAPFDVNYGGFSACNINAVTKSGTNNFEFKVFSEISSNNLRGDTVADDTNDHSRGSYDKTYYGFDVGGPIIKDKLFFFAAYSESDTPRFLKRGYAGSGNGEERDWLSQADYDRIDAIASTTYAYDTGGQPSDGVQANEKYLVRLDWNINDSHNAAVIYNYFDGFQARDSDGDSDEFEFANHFYRKGSENEQLTLKLNSQWTDRFSTEIFYNTSDFKDSQVTVGPADFADFQISIGGRDGVVYLGADDSRQANRLSADSEYIKLAGEFLTDNHIISAGYDREELNIFNIFVQHSNGGEYDFFDDSQGNDPACAALTAQERFDDVLALGCEMSGIDRYELGRPSRIYYGSGGGTNNPDDAAAVFSNTLNALYVQDEIFVDDMGLTLTVGLRYEFFESSDRPKFNQAFFDATGIRNDANIDGLDLLMPRFGFTWETSDTLELRGGIGLYSGGNPNVWISNAWSNDGLSNAQFRLDNFGGAISVLPGSAGAVPLSGAGQPGYDVPQSLVDDVAAVTPAAANDSSLALIDPDYEQPSEWKFAFGGTWDMPWQDIELQFDYLHTRGNDSAYYVDVSQAQVGTTIIGTPIYDYVGGAENNFMLTNSSESPVSNVISLVANKSFDFGLDVLVGYAYTDAEDVSPMTSATAGSNFDNLATSDIGNPSAAGSNYVVPHRFTLALDYEHVFFGDSATRISLFGYFNEGQPQSWAMGSGDLEGNGRFGRHLLYVPNGPGDTNVVFQPFVADGDVNPVTGQVADGDISAFDQTAFFNWVGANGLAPGLQERNAQHADWSTRFDLRISQQIPLPAKLQGNLYFKVYNFGNMLNDDWGKITDAQFFTPQVVNSDVDAQGRFVFNRFSDRSLETVIINRSLWEARIGFDVRFGG